jgi:membrane protein
MMRGKAWWQILKQTGASWSEDNATRLAASLAFYTVLSIAPLLVLSVAVAGWFFGEDAARGHIASQLASIVGEKAGEGIQTLLKHADQPDEGVLGSVLGIVVLLFGASGVFGELQAALNTIWEVEPKPGRGVWGMLRDRFFSFSLVLGVAFLLLVSLVLSAALSAMGAFFSSALPGGAFLWQTINFVFSFAVITILFAVLLRVVPDIKVPWKGIWPGAAVTALLFTIGKFALGLYLGRASVSSPYGAAGSVVVLVIWVYYAAQILFLGAEFTREYVRTRGMDIEPARDAVRVPDKQSRADQSTRAGVSAQSSPHVPRVGA